MARKAVVPTPPTPYELVARRVKRVILSPRAQLERQVSIARLADEPEEAWRELLDQIAEEESVTIEAREDGSVHLSWKPPRAE